LVPLQPPDAVQRAASVLDQLSMNGWPTTLARKSDVNVTLGATTVGAGSLLHPPTVEIASVIARLIERLRIPLAFVLNMSSCG
jgi:hypothetical protein